MHRSSSTSRLVLLVAIVALTGCEMYASIDTPDDDAEFLVGETVTFNGTADDPDGNAIVQWDWDFGDGDSETTVTGTVQHTYLDPGVYEVLLTVTNSIGATLGIEAIRCDAAMMPTGPLVLCGEMGTW